MSPLAPAHRSRWCRSLWNPWSIHFIPRMAILIQRRWRSILSLRILKRRYRSMLGLVMHERWCERNLPVAQTVWFRKMIVAFL